MNGEGVILPRLKITVIFTGRNEVVAKVMFLLVSVILSTMSGRYASYWNAFLCNVYFFYVQSRKTYLTPLPRPYPLPHPTFCVVK